MGTARPSRLTPTPQIPIYDTSGFAWVRNKLGSMCPDPRCMVYGHAYELAASTGIRLSEEPRCTRLDGPAPRTFGPPPFRCCSDADLNKPEKLASTRRGDERYACGMSVGVVFGLPDDGINGIMEALRTRQDRIRFVQVHHEESAAWPALTRSGREGFTYVSRRLARADASPDRSLRPSSVRRS